MRRLVLIFGFAFCFSACGWLQEEPLSKDDPVVIAAAQKRLENFIQIQLKRCRLNMMEKAEAKVDSLITELIEDYIQDTVFFPKIPVRPIFPKKLAADTSLIPKPLFDSLPIQKEKSISPDTTENSLKKNNG
jgi:hypothetical protein